MRLAPEQIRSGMKAGALYAYPREKSIRRFMDRCARAPDGVHRCRPKELIAELNPLLRGWGNYYKRTYVRRLFPPTRRLDSATHLVASLPATALQGLERIALSAVIRRKYGLVNLIRLIPSLASQWN